MKKRQHKEEQSKSNTNNRTFQAILAETEVEDHFDVSEAGTSHWTDNQTMGYDSRARVVIYKEDRAGYQA